MKKSILALFMLGACGAPSGEFPPFIHVNVVDPANFVAPLGENWEVTTSAIINGNFITNTNEVPDPANPLPSDLTIAFSEQVRGQNVTVFVEGFTNGVSVFSATGVAAAGSAELEVIARFCGDNGLDDDRSEECDDGANNSDIIPDACRLDCTSARCGDAILDSGEACDDGVSNSDTIPDACRTDCSVPSCGDGTIDAGEECDDTNNLDADGCEADCSLPACGNGILDPEDFEGNLCYAEDTTNSFFVGTDVEMADMDNDGSLDVIFSANGGTKVAFGDGQGGFSETKIFDPGSAFFIIVDDLDNNNSLDIFVNPNKIISNQGQRNFVVSTIAGINALDAVSGDFNSDGKNDLIVLQSELSLLTGKAGGFNNPVVLPFTMVSANAAGVESGDINQDGLIDLVITEAISGGNTKLTIAKNTGGGNFSFSSITLGGITSGGALFSQNVAIFDQDQDGQNEIATIDTNSGLIAVTSPVNAAVNNNTITSFIATQATTLAVRAIDIDLDGLDDLVFSTVNSMRVLLSVNSYQETLLTNSSVAVFAIGDLAENGVVDIVGNQIFLFEE